MMGETVKNINNWEIYSWWNLFFKKAILKEVQNRNVKKLDFILNSHDYDSNKLNWKLVMEI